MFNIKCIPCQVSTKDQDKERIGSVEASKVKEVNLEVARGKCGRRTWRSALCFTGEIANSFPRFAIILKSNWLGNVYSNISQRIGSCLAPSFLL